MHEGVSPDRRRQESPIEVEWLPHGRKEENIRQKRQPDVKWSRWCGHRGESCGSRNRSERRGCLDQPTMQIERLKHERQAEQSEPGLRMSSGSWLNGS